MRFSRPSVYSLAVALLTAASLHAQERTPGGLVPGSSVQAAAQAAPAQAPPVTSQPQVTAGQDGLEIGKARVH